MTSTALISEKERLYHFYVTCNMTKEDTCKAMGYYMKSNKNKISIHKLDEKLYLYEVFKPKFIIIFNKERGMYLKYGVKNCMDLSEVRDKIIQTNLKKIRYKVLYSNR